MMLKPKQVYGRKLWDVHKLDRSFDTSPADGEAARANPWD